MCLCMHLYVYICVHLCMCVCLSECVSVCMCMYVCMFVYRPHSRSALDFLSAAAAAVFLFAFRWK